MTTLKKLRELLSNSTPVCSVCKAWPCVSICSKQGSQALIAALRDLAEPMIDALDQARRVVRVSMGCNPDAPLGAHEMGGVVLPGCDRFEVDPTVSDTWDHWNECRRWMEKEMRDE